MDDDDSAAVAQRMIRLLNAASAAVSQNKEWADRVRENWAATEKSTRAGPVDDCDVKR